MKKKPKYNSNSVIRGALRRAFARSPLVQEVMAASRRESPRYKQDGTRHKKNWVQRQCQVCNNWESSSKMAVDHIIPVVCVDNGFVDWNEFIARLWCNISNLQRICDTCHDKKTAEERTARLLKQYTEELDQIEKTIQVMGGLRNLLEAGGITKKSLIKDLSKYTAKKKTVGLESVVQRALILKNGLKNK